MGRAGSVHAHGGCDAPVCGHSSRPSPDLSHARLCDLSSSSSESRIYREPLYQKINEMTTIASLISS